MARNPEPPQSAARSRSAVRAALLHLGGSCAMAAGLLPLTQLVLSTLDALPGQGLDGLAALLILVLAVVSAVICAYLALTWALAAIVLATGARGASGRALLRVLRTIAPRAAARVGMSIAVTAVGAGLLMGPASAARVPDPLPEPSGLQQTVSSPAGDLGADPLGTAGPAASRGIGAPVAAEIPQPGAGDGAPSDGGSAGTASPDSGSSPGAGSAPSTGSDVEPESAPDPEPEPVPGPEPEPEPEPTIPSLVWGEPLPLAPATQPEPSPAPGALAPAAQPGLPIDSAPSEPLPSLLPGAPSHAPTATASAAGQRDAIGDARHADETVSATAMASMAAETAGDAPLPDPLAESPQPRSIEVRAGDSLWEITDDLLGPGHDSSARIAALWPDLYDANLALIGADPDAIEPGQVLVVPSGFPMTPSDLTEEESR